MEFNILGYTFSVQKKVRKKARGFSARVWTKSEVDTLMRFRGEGKSTSEIAKLLKRTEPAIYSKLTKLKQPKPVEW